MQINLLNAELHPICHLLALLGAHHILHVSRIMVKVGRRGINHNYTSAVSYYTRCYVFRL
jgi:hypothetical protein